MKSFGFTRRCAENYANQNGIRPCKDCTERFVGCHSECEKYAAYKETAATLKAEVIRAEKTNDYIDFRRNMILSRIERNNLKARKNNER